jgi:hypothetical protein
MNIRETIKKVLKEDEKKSLFRVVTKLIDYFLLKNDVEKYICDYKLEPGKFAIKNSGERYQRLKVTLYFKPRPKKNMISWSEYDSVFTTGYSLEEEKIMNELQDLILDSLDIIVDMYASRATNCEKMNESIIKEESEIPLFVRRRNRYTEEEIINYLKKFAIQGFKLERVVAVVVWWACKNTAYEILDSTHTHIDTKDFNNEETKIANYLKEKYGKDIAEYISKFYNESGDEEGTTYIFWKHADRNGGNGFSEGFKTWNELLRRYGSWFPSLDWVDIKEKLDSIPDNKPLLIVEPDDKFNTMRYYFSLIKKKS